MKLSDMFLNTPVIFELIQMHHHQISVGDANLSDPFVPSIVMIVIVVSVNLIIIVLWLVTIAGRNHRFFVLFLSAQTIVVLWAFYVSLMTLFQMNHINVNSNINEFGIYALHNLCQFTSSLQGYRYRYPCA